ncbi:MAG TPA: hypothetical protein VNM40_02520 [Candidatus Paceibacterota bacterium]|nr:hypothetical protein [Candidatus Paceibacterota bacterium]
MGIEYDQDKLDEVLRIARENNRMLRSMRRSSFFGAIVKTVLWVALIIVPLWFYLQYIAPVMESMLQTYQQLQGTSAQAQAQFGELNRYLQQFQSLYGGGQ